MKEEKNYLVFSLTKTIIENLEKIAAISPKSSFVCCNNGGSRTASKS